MLRRMKTTWMSQAPARATRRSQLAPPPLEVLHLRRPLCQHRCTLPSCSQPARLAQEKPSSKAPYRTGFHDRARASPLLTFIVHPVRIDVVERPLVQRIVVVLWDLLHADDGAASSALGDLVRIRRERALERGRGLDGRRADSWWGE